MKVIDLSRPLHSEMSVFPGDPTVTIEPFHTYEKEGWELRKINMGTHTGTHVDAFSHMHKGLASIDELPIERFFGVAQVVELKQTWPTGRGLFFIEKIGLEYLEKILQASPKFIGGDISEDLEKSLLKHDILTYTDLTNLELLPKFQNFTFFGLPLKIQNGDGSPVRAIAILRNE